jgi:predicted nucleic acid-binding protein
MLLDSNVVVCAAQPEHGPLRQFIAAHAPAVSAVTKVELLGNPHLSDFERQHLEAFFAAATVLPLSPAVIERAVQLRQQRQMTLADALVAATALVFAQPLVTLLAQDFDGLEGLVTINPFDKQPA